MSTFSVGSRVVGPGEACYIVAELSANHGGSLQRAIDTVHAAAQAGADAIKLQTYRPETMTFRDGERSFRIADTPWAGRDLFGLYEEAQTPWEWHERLAREAGSAGLDWFSSPFDVTAVDFLETLAPPCYKIASFEIVDHLLLDKVGRTGKPVILSTGMSSLDEIGEAVETLRRAGCVDVALLKCTSAYPAPPDEMNLRTIPDLAHRFGTVVGLSDHTTALAVPVAAVTLGARIIEKHFILERALGGPDASFSLEPEEFASMVREVRLAERALGRVAYGPTASEQSSAIFRRSLFVVEPVEQGEAFSDANVRTLRPGVGLHPRHWRDIKGRRAARPVAAGTPLAWSHVAGADEAGEIADAAQQPEHRGVQETS